ncbi:MAG: RNA methyltransferase [candidate division Zixibacteria bacterium]|nr:RNA methyltransferase [candidate division Zixibacteria bacterium]
MSIWRDPDRWPLASQGRLALWRKLATKKGREQSGSILVEGVRLVSEALITGQTIETVLVMDNAQGIEAAGRVGQKCPRWNGPVTRVCARDFERLTDTVHAAGIAAVVRWQNRDLAMNRPDGSKMGRLLICDHVADPGNLGTLIRTAAGLGIDAVILTQGTVEVTNPKVVRGSAGAVFRIRIYSHVATAAAVAWCRERGIAIFVADAHQGELPAASTPGPLWALVIGGETIPLDPAWQTADARRLRLPLVAGVESLNAAIAGAILMDRLCRVSGT